MTFNTTNQIMAGAEVYGSDNDKLGTIADVGQNYFLVQKGFLFIKDLYLPTRTIARVDADRVYLNVTKHEAEAMATEELPAQGDAWYGTTAAVAADRSSTGRTGTMDTTYVTDDAATMTNRTAVDTTDRTMTDRTARTANTTNTVRDGDTISVPVVEEELRAGVREVDAGRARVVKDVTTEQQSIDVPVQHEEAFVTTRAVNRPATQEDMDMMSRDIEIPLREQEVVTSKQAMVTGEVEIRKETVTDTQRVTDSVRRETVRVEDPSNPHVHVEGASTIGSNFSVDQRARHDAMSPNVRTRYASLSDAQRMEYDTRYPIRRDNKGSILDPDGDGENAFEELGRNIKEGTNRPGNR